MEPVSGSGFFETIVVEASDGVVVLGPDRVCRFANPAAEFLLGARRQDLVGEMFGLPLFPTERPTRANVLSADGRMRVVELAVERLPADEAGLLVQLKDVTDYHQEAARAREEVKRRDEFLAMLSHELRNPLAAIQAAAQVLARDGLPAEHRRDAAEAFDRQFGHLRRILDDLLDLTRISRGKLEIRRERAGLCRLVRDAAAVAAPLAAAKRHDVRVKLPAEEVWVAGDPTRLAQVLANLLSNAAKYTQAGGQLEIAAAIREGMAEARVSDDGPGIPADLLPRVFEPFVQGPQPLDRREGGLGIGLALARSIVELHGGSITATPNADGPGMTFTIRLPLDEKGGGMAVQAARMAGRALRILLVEDNDDARRLLATLLALEGHEVRQASDGESGLEQCLEWLPDVALIDIGLPGIDGYELARRVRRDGRGRGIGLAALTGYGMPQDAAEARAAGFDHHLTKPLRPDELASLLGRFAEGARE
ncbi:MAG: response regulator [Gemmataceae bacterium]|nr:response regulator [Gemmataceae bacterium]